MREEAFLIAREALGNAFRHSGAKDIEVEVTCGDAALHIRGRDDGRGISAPVLEAGGRPQHFGLVKKSILPKLDASDRTHAVMIALKRGILDI